MRFLNKYKLYSNRSSSIKKAPLRILNFKRPKWLRIKKKIKTRQKISFVNWSVDRVSRRFKPRIKKYYNTKLQTRVKMSSLFDSSIDFKVKTKERSKNNVISFHLVKPLFRIDILLWYLKFFHSSYECRQNVNNKVILVNEKNVKSNYFVKKGDVLTFKNKIDNSKNLSKYSSFRKNYVKNRISFSFLEIDHYSKTIIIIKDLKDLTADDFQLLIQEKINVRHLI